MNANITAHEVILLFFYLMKVILFFTYK